MIPLVRDNLVPLAEICRRHHVLRLELFGSAAGKDFTAEKSDLDFVVEFLPVPRGGLHDVYFDLLEDLERLFARKVDLVETSAIRNRFFPGIDRRNKGPRLCRGVMYECTSRTLSSRAITHFFTSKERPKNSI